MRDEEEQIYRGHRIIARELGCVWQARIEGIGALSSWHPTALEAINEVKRYLDDQAPK